MNRFEELLNQLGEALNMTLDTDQRGICKLFVNNQIHVQIEYDANKDRLLLGTFAAEIPPRKISRNVLKEALKANYPFPRICTLAFSERKNALALFSYLYTFNLNGEKIRRCAYAICRN